MGSEFLFARPSFLSGVARSLDLGATFDEYNASRSEQEADFRALSADWRAVGEALSTAVEHAGHTEPELARRHVDRVEA